MENLITVISLQGQAWAVAQDGTRRELKVGDTVAADEMVITADGAQIDLQFANNNQVLTLIGEQETPVDLVQVAQDAELSQPMTPINTETHTPTQIDSSRGGPSLKDGHNFVQLVRIQEIIEADGFTPLSVARIQEVIQPLGMVLPERDFEQDRWKDNVSRNEHGSSRQYKISISIDVIAEDDIINAAEAQQDITITGTVDGDVKPGDKVTVTVNGKTYETTVNPDGKTWAVDVPGSELVQDKTVAATVTGNTPTGETITAETERPYEVLTELPKVEVELEGAGDDGVYNESEIVNGKVPATVTLDPETVKEGDILKVTTPNGDVLLERPVTQDDIDNGVPVQVPVEPGQETVIVEATVTNPEGNTGTGRDEKPVDNITPRVEIQLEGSGDDGVYNESEIVNDEVPAKVTLDKDTVKVGDTLVVKTPDGNVLLDRPVTQDDIDNGVPVQVPVTPGQTTVTVEATITDPAGNSSSSSDTKPVDNLPPELVGSLDPQNDADADDITLDLSKEFNDEFSGKDLTYQATDLPAGLTIDPNTGIISGTIDSSASQGGNTGTQGDYKVTITVTDPAGNSNEHEFIWTVTNPAPIAQDDEGATDEDTSLIVTAEDGVLKNDNDPDGDQLYVTGIVAGENKPASPGGLNTEITGKYGTLKLQEDGSYTYTPDKDNPVVRALKGGESIEDTFSYTMTDREGGEDDAVLRITINGVTDSEPTIIPEDHNGSDVPSDPLTAGHATVYESGLVASDPAEQSKKTATGEITVETKDGLVSVSVAGQDFDLDALADLQANNVTIETEYGKLMLTGFTPEDVNGTTVGGELSYSYELTTPFANAEPGKAGDENGLDKIDLKVVDAGAAESTGTLDINIIDDVPVAKPDEGSVVNEGALLTGDVLSNDKSGADGWTMDGANVAAVVGVVAGTGGVEENANVGNSIAGTYGTLTLNADGSYRYKANPDATTENVQDVFTYTVKDADGDLVETTLTINVQDVTVAPTPATGEVKESGLTGGTTEGSGHTTTGSLNLPAGQTATAKTGTATHGTFEVNADGTYTYTLTDKTNGNDVKDSFTYTSTDANGNTVENTVTITIVNDVPVAEEDTHDVVEGATLDVDATNGVLSNDQSGADGWKMDGGNVAAVVGVVNGSATSPAENNQVGSSLEGDYGSLTLNADGSYTYVSRPDAVTTNETDVFTYTVRDGDGDLSHTTLTINIIDVTGISTTTSTGKVDEAGIIADGDQPAGSKGDGSHKIVNESLELQHGWSVVDESDNLSGTTSFGSWEINPVDGTYNYTLTKATTDVDGVDETDSFTYTAQDANGNTVTNTVTVTIIDDVPSIAVDADKVGNLEVDETDFVPATDANFVDGVFTTTEGADGASTTYSLEVEDGGVDSGLIDTATGKPILLYQDGTDVVGRFKDESDTDVEAFRIEINADTGSVTLTQARPLDHPLKGSTPKAHDDPVSINSDAIKLYATAVDGDGDTVKSNGVEVGGRFTFRDDGPTLKDGQVDQDGFVIGNEIVDEQHLPTGSASDATELTVTKELPINFGADGAVSAANETGLIFTNTGALEALNLKSGTTDLTYALSGDGHTITATAGGKEIFTITLSVDGDGKPSYEFTLQGPLDHTLKTDDDNKEYAENIVLPFDITAIDGDGDSVDLKFKVEVKDDTPPSDTRELDVDEDDSVSFSNADVNQTTTTVTTDAQHGTVIIGNDGTVTYEPNEDYRGEDTYTYTVTTANGSYERTVNITVKPVSDKPLFADEDGNYPADTAIDSDGSLNTGTYDYSVQTPEDVPVGLRLHVPKVKDGGSAATSDPSELLGAITIEFKELATDYTPELQLADGTILSPNVSGGFQFVIVDNETDKNPLDWHLKEGLPTEGNGVHYLTEDQYQGLQVQPPAERHENFDVEVSVSSYEVDADGKKLADVDGATSTQTIDVKVQAVTDPIELKIDTDKDAHSYEMDEDTAFNLKDKLTVNYPDDYVNSHSERDYNDGDGVTGPDLDGSEKRWFEITGLPKDAVVNGITVTGPDHVITIEAPGLRTSADELPDINITPPKDFSGDMKGIKVTLKAQDKDSDAGDIDGLVEEDSITLELQVNPVAGDVAIEGTEGLEDTAIKFLENIKVTDDSTATETLGEVITEVSFTVPSGPTGWTIDAVNNTWSNAEGQTWTMNEPADGAGWSGAWSGDTYTITFDGDNTDPINGLSKEARENILKEFTVTPPAHSSKDIDLSVEVTSVDHSIIAGGSSSDPVSKTETITVVVKPVAERVDTDSDGADGNDVTIGDNHVYDTTGEEDKWFVLGDETSSGFKLSAGWSNEDGKWVNDGGWKDVSSSGDSSDETGRSEDTFALLTPYMTKDNDARHNPGNPTENLADKLEGSVFTYEGPDGLVTLPFAGEPVKIPMQYLDTVQFKGPQDWSGVVKVRVQAGTVDYDEDDNAATKLEVSGESWLTNLIIGPKADQVTLKVDAIIKTPEDTQVPLNIIPTSSDPSETFNITIKGIPKGAKITYDGVEYDTLAGTLPSGLTEEGGSYTLKIENFDTSKQPTLTPPKDSNVTIELEVTAQSVDTLTYIDKDGNTVTVTDTDPSKSHTLNTEVQVQGVPDVPVLTLVENKVYTEDANDQDSGQLKVTLSDLITGLKSGETGVADAGPDGSETVTLRISGLPEGFNLENAGPALGGSGENRVWVITEADLASVQIVVPQHYSGTVNFTAQPVVTENDNPSKVFFDPQNVKFEITPVPEATLSLSSSLIEDTIGELELMPVGDDSDEYISAVRIAEDAVTTAGVTLYDADGNPLTASGGYYTVTNTGTTGAPVVKVKGPANFSGEIKLDIQYQVTDPMTSDTSTAVTSGWQTQGHTLNFAAVTDKIDLALGTITGGDTAAGVTTVTSASTVKVGLNITQKADSNAGGAQDTDGSEKFTHVVVSGVPAGVSVKNAIETAPGEWLITVGELPFNTAELTHSLEFMVSGYADTFEQAITITTYTQDTGAATIEEDSIEWTLKYVSDDGPDPVDLPELDLTAIETSQTEDVSFVLGSVVTGEVIGGSTSAPFDLTVTIRATPDDETTYSGMTRTLVTEGGQQVALWTATVSGVTPANAQTKLDGLLNGITVTPPQDANSNNIAGGTLDLDVNVSAHAHGVSRDAQVTPKLPITPVTDNVIVSVSENVVGEGETIDLNISLSSENDADGTLNATGAGWTVVGDTVFIHIADGLEGALYVNGVMNSGSGTAPAGAPTGLTGGKYYQVTVADLDKLEFRPDAGSPHQTGSLGVTAWVEHKENNDAGSKVSTGEGSLTIEQSNSGYEATITATGEEAQTSGDKEDAIELNFGADAGLVDTNEEVSSAYISGLPSGFTVYAGTDAASSSMANNAGNDTWVIPVTGGALPAYIAILPPANWSGSLTGVNLTVLSGHTGLTPTPTELPITFEVTPVASGISLNPTLSFGDAGELIALNLNASMKDPVAATGATGDAHTERTELKLTGFSGGAKVQFFIGTEVGDGTLDGRVTHDGGGNYTIRDLTQTELDNLKFVHGVTNGEKEISISARTYEVDGSGNKVGVDSAEVTATMNINISPVVATSGADVFLWDGTDINGFGGVDTVQLRFGDDLGSGDFAKLENIEIIDMSGAASGVNSIDSLTPEDVFNMTDGDNKLTILRDSSDTVGLDASWGSGTTAGNTTTYSHTDNGVTVDLTVTLVD